MSLKFRKCLWSTVVDEEQIICVPQQSNSPIAYLSTQINSKNTARQLIPFRVELIIYENK